VCDPAGCPGDDTTCQTPACVDGDCGFEYAEAGTLCDEGGGVACDGSGHCSKEDGSACSTADECLSGYCADGVCCALGCDGPCRACDAPGSVGTCTMHPSGGDPDGDCQTDETCDGAGSCLLLDGASCQIADDCLSGFCADGVCCATECAGLCEACNLVGVEGTCTPHPAGADPDSECATGACNGLGSCGCPAAGGTAAAGPYATYGFCWYLAAAGATCDAACASITGSNLAVQAQNAWPDACDSAQPGDISTWFYNNGNPGSWAATTGTTGYHTLGYGYTGSNYYGKCASGTATGHGTFPGDTNDNPSRSVVCPCFVAP
jgi:hypothetical protein